MARLPYPDPAQQSETVRDYIARSRGLNIVRMLSHASPAVFEGFNSLSGSIMMRSSLDPVLRETAILRVGYLSQAAYEIYHHEAVGREVGLAQSQLDAIARGVADPVLTREQQAVVAFTSDVVLRVKASDQTLAAVREFLDETAVVDLLLTIGCYMMVARLLETTGVELDQAPLVAGELSGNQ
jgi:4-carboxymuconolactone decarboxylase